MAEFKRVATKSDLAAGSGMALDLSGKRLAIFNVDGDYCAIDDTCLHKGGPLGEGMLLDGIVTCPWHGWEYDVKTGVCQTNPQMKVTAYEVRVEGDDILVSED